MSNSVLSPEDLAAARVCGASAGPLPIAILPALDAIFGTAYRAVLREEADRRRKEAAEAEREAAKVKAAKKKRVNRDPGA